MNTIVCPHCGKRVDEKLIPGQHVLYKGLEAYVIRYWDFNRMWSVLVFGKDGVASVMDLAREEFDVIG